MEGRLRAEYLLVKKKKPKKKLKMSQLFNIILEFAGKIATNHVGGKGPDINKLFPALAWHQ